MFQPVQPLPVVEDFFQERKGPPILRRRSFLLFFNTLSDRLDQMTLPFRIVAALQHLCVLGDDLLFKIQDLAYYVLQSDF